VHDETLDKIRIAKTQRLEVLEIQAAQQGEMLAPPHILNERERLRAELGLLDPMARPPIDAATRRTVRKYYQDDLDFLMDQMAKFGMRLTGVEETVRSERDARPSRQRVLSMWLGGLAVLGIMTAVGVLT
jgi:hypothetical protein